VRMKSTPTARAVFRAVSIGTRFGVVGRAAMVWEVILGLAG
jgi:hypothetical protein